MRELSHEEIIGVTTLNVCVNAVRDSVEKLGRRLTGDQKSAIDQSAGRLTEVVKQLSAKPEEMRRMIEKVSYEPRIELFARETHEGWDTWGNECKCDVWKREGA